MNNIDVDPHDTNKSSRKQHDPKKRAVDEQNDDSQSTPAVDQVTVGQLEQQVDDLVESYNKLAKTLNRPQIHEANANGIVFTTSKTVRSSRFCPQLVSIICMIQMIPICSLLHFTKMSVVTMITVCSRRIFIEINAKFFLLGR